MDTGFIGAISGAKSEREVAELAVARAAAALDLAAALVIRPREGKAAEVLGADGPEKAIVKLREQLASAEISQLPGLGSVSVAAEEVGETDCRLVAVRLSDLPFESRDLELLKMLAEVTALGMRLVQGLQAEAEGRLIRARDHRSRVRSESRFRALVERVPAAMYIAEVGPEAPWRYVSPRIEDILGYQPDEWLADPSLWAKRLHPDDRERALSFERSTDGSQEAAETAVDYRMLTRDGEVVWIMDDAELALDERGVAVWHGMLYDITGRKDAERALEQLAAQQASLAELGERAIEGTDLSRLMSAATKLVMGDVATHSCVWERAPHGGDLRLRFGLDRVEKNAPGRVSAGVDSHAGAAVRSLRPVLVEDWKTEERYSMPPALRELGIRSSIAVVIECQDEPYGVLDVHSNVPGAFGLSDMHLAQAAANVLASAIERRRGDAELRHRVLHDSLTGLPNRQRFMELLEQALGRARETDTPIAVLFLDLDHFKLINDSLGHHVGDELLRVVAPRLAGRLRPKDTVARFGGDEFGMLVEDLTDEAEALAIAERVGRALARPISIDGMEHYVTASIGIAVADPRSGKSVDAESLVRDADAAMYRAKESGRARHQLFGEEMRAYALRRLETQRKLRRAIEYDELTIRYQPVVSLSGGGIVGTEALVRWRHPDRGLLSPQEFIPVAEESGLIVGIGRWVIEESVRQTLRWHQQNPDSRPVNIAINVSPRQVVHKDLVDTIEELLESTSIAPELLQLEITENVLVEESIAVRETLQRLHELGVGLVLDDFGTGYSSLAYLNRFPLSALKIDRSFIDKVARQSAGGGERAESGESPSGGAAIVQAILAMADALSLGVIAEGVCEPSQALFLRDQGCQMAQGFLFSRPVPPEEISDLLRNPEQVLAPLRG